MKNRLAQIIFRIETNLQFISRHIDPQCIHKGNESVRAIQRDLEELKQLKENLTKD